ncbi:MAG: DNA repair protein RadA, partial [Oscillospiraceae bacterium]
MAKTKFVCQQCGYESPKWMGKCPNCGNWNCFEEEAVVTSSASNKVSISNSKSTAKAYRLSEIDVNDEVRFHTGVSELDRVLGGGIVKGSVVLLGGDPGIGKSTLLMQICQYLGDSLSVMYISGEESARQLKLRADRLGVNTDNLQIIANTDVESIVSTIMQVKPDIVMIDSIQTMSIGSVSSSPGSIVQVRESTNVFLRVAKGEDIPIIIVGHVNKDGAIAGPKVLEHIVDTVLYFEGERNLSYRILRAVKNRFGSTNEIGVFEMQDIGLAEVENPSQMLLSGRPTDVSGICVACIMEGTRPILVEV